MQDGIEGLIGAAELLFRELRADKSNFIHDVQKKFKGVLYVLGHSIAKRCDTQEEFENVFSKIALHPVDGLWHPKSVLYGAKDAKNNQISVPKVKAQYLQLPICAGALRLLAKPGVEFRIRDGVYSALTHDPYGYGSPVNCQFVRGTRYKEGSDIFEFCGGSVASSIDEERIKVYEDRLRC